MSHEPVTQEAEHTHAFDGPNLQSSSGGASLPPPPFQLQVSYDQECDQMGRGNTGIRHHGEESGGPAANISEDILLHIYTAAGSREQAQTLVRSLTGDEINTAYADTQAVEAAEVADHEANPMNEFDVQEDGDAIARQSQNVEWDHEGFEENSENDWGDANISPRDTGTDPATLREAFETHRLIELNRLVQTEVTLPQMMAARRLADAHNPTLAEGVRRLLFMANEYAVVQTLNPEQSQRYRPGRLRGRGTQTFCNTYVHDILRSFGVAERAIPGGRANRLSDAMHRQSMSRYWTEITEGAEVAQQRADAGRLVIATAHGNTRQPNAREIARGETGPFFHAGHISLILPQNDAHDAHAGRADNGQFSPLESNAGGGSEWVGEGEDRRPSANWRFQNRADLYRDNPEVYLRDRRGGQRNRDVNWWSSGHRDGAFWEYTGAFSNPEALNSPEAMGLAVNPPRER